MADDSWDAPWDSGPTQFTAPQLPTNVDNWRENKTQRFTNSTRRGSGGRRGDDWNEGRRGRRNNDHGWKNKDTNEGWGNIPHDISDNWGNTGHTNKDSNDSWNNDRWDNRGQNSRDNRRGAKDKCEIIKIPTKMVGRVIGRGGLQIEELQIRSSARIQVTKETDGSETVVKIFGNDSTIAKAKELIDGITEEKPKPAPEEREIPIVPPQTSSNEAFEQAKLQPGYNWFKFLKECDARVEEEWNKLPPIIKNFYQEHPEVSTMSNQEMEAFRLENNNIVVNRTFENEDSKPVPKPVYTFAQAFHNYPEILDEIKKAGFEKPSPIQCQAWPVLLSGEDLIGIAQTGTGKTLAFLLPALIHIDGQTVPREERGGPAVLIMAPTRELALQIDKEVKKYYYRGITSVCVYGGGDRKAQVDVVSHGVDIVIATPGRMNDLNEAGHLNVRSVTYVVLDEADRMLDMGFEPQIRKVMYSLRPTRQSIMTSATWPPGVRRLAQSYMKDPVQVYVGSLDLAATHSVTQIIQLIDEREKEETFLNFARNLGPDEKMIVFCGTKAKADHLSVECALQNISSTALHGNRDQADREQAVADITSGVVKILIATDVASRGLDIDDITHVLNYDFPKNIEEYVHRVGRTGRAGKTGESISYFTRNDWGQAAELIKILEEADQFIPEEIYDMAKRYEAMKERREKAGEPLGGRRGGSRFGIGGGRRY
ncbi:probable ATP-dependent RNA helicase DDX43 [Euwallacea similis]|uniref:probable ATP-dependent RNA helicase DDX43 n=1 Tax=Euwallacea similis TaxID=1736056 RepID=UPI00344D1408